MSLSLYKCVGNSGRESILEFAFHGNLAVCCGVELVYSSVLEFAFHGNLQVCFGVELVHYSFDS